MYVEVVQQQARVKDLPEVVVGEDDALPRFVRALL